MFPRIVHTWEHTDDLYHILMYFKWSSLNQSLNKFCVTQSFSKQKQRTVSFKVFRSESSRKTSKKNEHDRKKYSADLWFRSFVWKLSAKVEILQLRAKFQTAVVPCSRFVWIANSSDHRRIWTANLLHTK